MRACRREEEQGRGGPASALREHLSGMQTPREWPTDAMAGGLPQARALPRAFGNVWEAAVESERTLPLLAQTKALDNLAIPIRVTAVQVIQQATALVDHHDQSAPRCMILHVRLQMRSQVCDPLAQQCNLHFRRAGIFRMGPDTVRSTLTWLRSNRPLRRTLSMLYSSSLRPA